MGAIFTDRERRSIAPPQKLKPSDWANANRFLPSDVAAEPGRYNTDRTPYIVGILDAACEAGIEEICVLKSVQVGYTTGLQSLIGWAIDNEPAPALLVMPSEKDSRDLVTEQLEPLIENTPALQSHLTDDPNDQTKSTLRFDTMPLYLGWAGSPSTLARRACRYVFLDEVDKFKAFSGKDADPINLARARTATFGHRRKIIIGSTPTTRDGHIWKCYQGCGDKRAYFVPCPHEGCGLFQRLVFSQLQFQQPEVKAISDRVKRADYIEQNQLAYYECEHCKGKITDRHKPKMMGAGVWLSEGQTIDRNGNVRGERPKSKRVGFHISALYSPWASFSFIAAKFLRAKGNTAAMMEFKNQWLGEVFEEVISTIKIEDVRESLITAPPALIVPKWANVLISSADTQDNKFYFVIRAHGAERRSQLVHFGEVTSTAELHRVCLDTAYQINGWPGHSLMPRILLIDSGGHRTDEIYDFARIDPRILPIKGSPSKPKQLVTYSQTAKSNGVTFALVDTDFFKDQLAHLRRDGLWNVNNQTTDEYLRQLTSQHKVMINGRMVWQTISVGGADHYLDTEVYNLAGAEVLQVYVSAQSETDLEQQRAKAEELRKPAAQPTQQPQTSSWLNTGGKSWLGR